MNDPMNISIEKVDEWIVNVSKCKLLSEITIKALCEKV